MNDMIQNQPKTLKALLSISVAVIMLFTIPIAAHATSHDSLDNEFLEIEIADMQSLSENEALRAMYETEPNNTTSTANTIYNDGTTYGRIAYQGDVDYYKVKFAYGGKANFWLGDIPTGKNYDLYLYNSAGGLLTSSTSTSNQELINHYPVSANTWYYLRVVSPNNSYDVSHYYRIRAKCYATKSARIYYDSSCTYSASELNSFYSSAVSAFVTEFNIEFNRASTSKSSLLNGSNCPNTTNSAICNATCGTLSNCSSSHHKGSGRLYTVNSSSSYYTYNLVGHKLCYYDSTHYEVVGLGSRPGKNAITSVYSSPNVSRSIQHELTHNLGGSHSTCTEGQYCVLKGNMDYWCDACRANILNNR